MNQLFDYVIRLCRFEAGPQDGPSIPVAAMVLYGITGFLQTAAVLPSAMAAWQMVLAEAVMLLVASAVLLGALQKPKRWPQTITALALSGSFFNVLALIAVLASPAALLPMLALGLVIWSLVVSANILRHATEQPFILAVAMMLAYQVLVFSVLKPDMAPAGSIDGYPAGASVEQSIISN